MKIVFMGTPDYAAVALEALIEAGHEITAVVTQPDKAKGRSKELQFPPVKECALKYNIPIMQPVRIKTPEAIMQLKQYEADVYIVAAFGQILSTEILEMVRYGCINIHASLLPKYRGASPIQHVIIDNEAETGITIMQMDAGIDTGDILYKKSLYLENNDTFETLHDKLAILGGEAIVEALKLVETGDIVPQKQNDEESCYAPIIKKELGNIDFAQSAIQIECFIRGLNPWPSAFTYFKGKQFKIWKAHVLEAVQGNPGEVIEVSKDCIVVGTGKGAIAIDILQIEGKKRMSTHDYLLGVEVKIGDIFTNTR